MSKFRPALFLDRDGVLNIDQGFVCKVDDFQWVDGALDCIKAFNARDWLVFVVTNQSGIAFGHYTAADMDAVHEAMLRDVRLAGASIDHIYHCPYHPDGTVPHYRKDSFARKPNPGMILQAMADYRVRREYSFLIGDKPTDIAAAKAAEIGGFLFTGGNLADFAEWTLAGFEDGAR